MEVYRRVRNNWNRRYQGQCNNRLYTFEVEGPASAFDLPEWLADHLIRQSYCQSEDHYRLALEESPVAAPQEATLVPDIEWVQCSECEQKFEAGSERFADHVSKHELARRRQPKEEASPITRKKGKDSD